MTDPTGEAYLLFQTAYDYFNQALFDDQLPKCVITFQRQKRLMGYVSFRRWYHAAEGKFSDELAINPEYFANYSLMDIFQTLCHEMVHVWQSHFGHPSRSGYHNEEWARKMIAIGLMPSTTGKPGGAIVGQTVSDYILSDGPFLAACTQFIHSGVQISWVDAFPIPRPASPTPIYDANGLEVSSAPSHKKQSEKPEDHSSDSQEPLLEGLPYSMETIEQAFLAASPFQSADDTHAIPSSKPANKSNRHKYYCSGCYMKVWGKPDLNILCGDCGIPLLETE